MFETLIAFSPQPGDLDDFLELDKLPPAKLLAAQAKTEKWLQELGATDDTTVLDEQQRQDARRAFQAVVLSPDEANQRDKLMMVKTPEAVRHLVGMLTAYDWEFVQQTKELRGYAVAQLL